MSSMDQYNHYVKSGMNFASWYKTKSQELEALQKVPRSYQRAPAHDGDVAISRKSQGPVLDALQLPGRSGPRRTESTSGYARAKGLVRNQDPVQASLAQAQATLAQLPPLPSRRNEAAQRNEPKPEVNFHDTPEMELALAEGRSRRQQKSVPKETKRSPTSPGPSPSLWQRRGSPTVRPLEEIRRQKDLEAAQEAVLLRRATSMAY
jgi:hypothetical protein|mmetsp:Transcript_646/g.1119  ORF Transcript_646/g.1119 Transcript_646/m.1119 type:complete len:206 (+) Transcript_646:33-650(+)|eukprot:CAMPEP_0174329326 /NCGR_PEP_ID=MMETSP0810-20121108/15755_1 /TAXON_ID=73025 ORGANISM="Eutreptiella gymnastica-like, Strain CCMP1594" /NCGR_SAMPLE_ID=MMETSP0810 /ASSEMBLY_ACC=CAM_ASM_000659 /LENGTH=205 /DNA_ID=CAMNT_0015443761 /DNA_START=33 /DNA_END=650 /DNA_ORIENTATION=+